MNLNENFFERVYEVVKKIPPGRVTSYGAIAKYLSTPQAARMVGWALNNLKSRDTFIPAHRVVNRNGQLSGKMHFRNPDMMQQLLESEGIIIEGDVVINFASIFWDPIKELPMAYNE